MLWNVLPVLWRRCHFPHHAHKYSLRIQAHWGYSSLLSRWRLNRIHPGLQFAKNEMRQSTRSKLFLRPISCCSNEDGLQSKKKKKNLISKPCLLANTSYAALHRAIRFGSSLLGKASSCGSYSVLPTATRGLAGTTDRSRRLALQTLQGTRAHLFMSVTTSRLH